MIRSRFFLLSSLMMLGSLSTVQAQGSNYYNPYNRSSGITSGGFNTSGNGFSYFAPNRFGLPAFGYVPSGPIGAIYTSPQGTVAVPANSLTPGVFGYNGYDPYRSVTRGSTSTIRYSGGQNYTDNKISRLEPVQPRVKEGPRRILDEWILDRADQGVVIEELRQQANQEALIRSLTEPSFNEVFSGQALNVVLNALDAKQGKLPVTQAIPVEESILKLINFTKGATSGQFGLLKDGGQIQWPKGILSLADDEAKKIRAEVEKQFKLAYEQASKGKVDPTVSKALDNATIRLDDLVSHTSNKIGFDAHREAKKFVNSLRETVTFLQQPDVQNWMPGNHAFEKKTIQDIVKLMAEKRLRFAPAVQGSEKAYLEVHRALVNYYSAIQQASK